MPNFIEATNSENQVFADDAISDIIKRASLTYDLVTAAATQVKDLSIKQKFWHKEKIKHFHNGDFNKPKPVLWANTDYEFDYDNDGSITLCFFNDDDTTLAINATSDLTSHIERGFGYVAFDDLEVTSITISDADDNTYKVHVSNELATKILDDYICCALSNNRVDYSTSLSELKEKAVDDMSYSRDTHAYYGVSKSDF